MRHIPPSVHLSVTKGTDTSFSPTTHLHLLPASFVSKCLSVCESLRAPQLVLSCPTTVLPSPLPCLALLQPGPQVTLLMPPSLEGQLGDWLLEGPPRHPRVAVGWALLETLASLCPLLQWPGIWALEQMGPLAFWGAVSTIVFGDQEASQGVRLGSRLKNRSVAEWWFPPKKSSAP